MLRAIDTHIFIDLVDVAGEISRDVHGECEGKRKRAHFGKIYLLLVK